MGKTFFANTAQPSSTITAATLAGMAMTFVWELVAQIGYEPRATLVASSVTFVTAAVGYFKRENVWPAGKSADKPDGKVGA